MMFADDIVLCRNAREEIEKTKAWQRVMEERGLEVNRMEVNRMTNIQ
jgi:hypothetical protein